MSIFLLVCLMVLLAKVQKMQNINLLFIAKEEDENSVWQVSCVAFMDMPRKGYTFIIVCILTYVKVTFFRNLLNRE